MANNQYSSAPKAPPGVSIEENVKEAREYAENHSRTEVYLWFYEKVRNNADGHNPNSWDYKQLGGEYADFGNYNYGATGAAMGIPEDVLLRMAGAAQMKAGTWEPGYGLPIAFPPQNTEGRFF